MVVAVEAVALLQPVVVAAEVNQLPVACKVVPEALQRPVVVLPVVVLPVVVAVELLL